MTIGEAINRDVRFIRKPAWNPYARLELVKAPDETQGPWVKLHDIDPDGQILNGTTDISLFQADDGMDDWEEWWCSVPSQ